MISCTGEYVVRALWVMPPVFPPPLSGYAAGARPEIGKSRALEAHGLSDGAQALWKKRSACLLARQARPRRSRPRAGKDRRRVLWGRTACAGDQLKKIVVSSKGEGRRRIDVVPPVLDKSTDANGVSERDPAGGKEQPELQPPQHNTEFSHMSHETRAQGPLNARNPSAFFRQSIRIAGENAWDRFGTRRIQSAMPHDQSSMGQPPEHRLESSTTILDLVETTEAGTLESHRGVIESFRRR